MPALGMAQETGKLLAWLKQPGDAVAKGEPVMEIETDKATVEIESPADGTLAGVRAQPGDEVPVGQVIAWIVQAGEAIPPSESVPQDRPQEQATDPTPAGEKKVAPAISPVARRMAGEHQVDLAGLKPDSGRIRKADVRALLDQQAAPATRLVPASPKARRLASEMGIDLQGLQGSGPGGAVLAADVVAASVESTAPVMDASLPPSPTSQAVSTLWKVMSERVAHSWATVPHFYLVREVNASRLQAWRERAGTRNGQRLTYTDLLVKLLAAALQRHPALNATWEAGQILRHHEINIALAVAVEDGLVAPVVHRADQLSLAEIAERREELIRRAQTRKLRPQDLENGTITLSNLGMYGVDAFNAIVNAPQAAILAVGRIAERVVPLNGQISIQPMLAITLSCDHRVVDGARAARFLETLADLIEEPLGLIQ